MNFQNEVAKLAYELYEKNGRREGHELIDWLAAEQIVRFQRMILPEMNGERVELLEYKPLSDGPVAAPRMPRIRPKSPSGRKRPEGSRKSL